MKSLFPLLLLTTLSAGCVDALGPTLVGAWGLDCDADGFSNGRTRDVLRVDADGTGTLRSWDDLDGATWGGDLSPDGGSLTFWGSAEYHRGAIDYRCELEGTAVLEDSDHAVVQFASDCRGDAGNSTFDCAWRDPSPRCDGFDDDSCLD